jgi:hypothetical protein
MWINNRTKEVKYPLGHGNAFSMYQEVAGQETIDNRTEFQLAD